MEIKFFALQNIKWRWRGTIPQPLIRKTSALPIELHPHNFQ